MSIKFTPPVESPKALVCTPEGRLYPQLIGTALAYHPFRGITSAEGKVGFTVLAGSEGGSWLLEGEEIGKRVPAIGAIDPPLTPVVRRVTADIPQRIYELLKTDGTRHREVLHMSESAATGHGDPASDQAVLLAFLRTSLGQLTTNFGPIHAGTHAAVEFYDQTASTAVLDTRVANEIANAVLNKQPLPADAVHLPTLAEYEASAGPALRGTLTPQPEEQVTYFGFPYPPLSENGEADAQFYNECLKPNALYFRVEVHSPVRLIFTDSHGRRFGLDASGRAVRGAPGLLINDPVHNTQTFIVPAGSYRMALSGSASGSAHILAFTPGSTATRAQVVAFPARAGAKGTATLGAGGLGGSVGFAGHRYRVVAGVGMHIHLSATRLRHGAGTRSVTVQITDEFGRMLPNAAVSVSRGKTVVAAAVTNARGLATVGIPVSSKGVDVVRASSRLTRAATVSLRIR